MNPYDTSGANSKSSSSGNAAAMAQMDPAWLAYYQSMSYYSAMQAGMPGATVSSASTSTTTSTTDSTATSNNNSAAPSGRYLFFLISLLFYLKIII